MATLDLQYERAYQVSSKWNTIVDSVFSGKEQRRNAWTVPQRKWVLDFSLSAVDAGTLLAFFDARKGRFESFYWTWQDAHPIKGTNMGGDGQQHKVRFDADELSFKHSFNGNKSCQITLVEVNS